MNDNGDIVAVVELQLVIKWQKDSVSISFIFS